MALETGTYISDLVAANPTSGDPVSQADDHMRLIKSTVKASFPNITGAMNATQGELNRLVGSLGVVIDRAYAEYTTNTNLSTQIPNDGTIPQNTEGTQIISLAFSAKSATTRVRLRFVGQVTAAASVSVAAALFTSASASAVRASFVTIGGADQAATMVLEYEYVPGTTSAITYTVRVGPFSAINVRLNGTSGGSALGAASAATLTIDEFAV